MAHPLSYQHVATELRLYHGDDSLAFLKSELERAGSRRAVVVCGRTISRSDALARMREALGSSIVGVAASARKTAPSPASRRRRAPSPTTTPTRSSRSAAVRPR